jgi:O-antigen ligase
MNARPTDWRSVSSWRPSLGTTSAPKALLVSFLGAALLVRLLTDDLSSPDSRHSGSLNLSGLIAVAFILLAAGLLLRHRRGVLPTTLAVLWLCVWTAIAVHTSGASTETLREGVREASVVALAVIVYNARGAVTVSSAARLVQLIGFAPALVALYQYATFTGTHRPYGTFAHPDSAAMFFAIAAVASLWRYLDDGRRLSDALLVTLFALALIATFSIDGLATLVAMLIAFGALHPGAPRVKLGPCVIAAAVILAFFATPLGAKRIASESSTAVTATGEPDSSIAWRLKKWKMLIPEWEESPLFGQGLGTTTTAEGPPGNVYISKPPHNEYIRYLVESGVVGIITLIVALAVLARGLIRRRRLPGTRSAGTFNAPTLAIVVVFGCLVDSLADNTLLNSPTCYAAALIVVAALCLPGAEAQTRQPPQTV